MKEFNGHKVITMDDWTDSFSKIAKPGDYVEEKIVNQMRDCLPPACMRWNLLQVGEAYSHREDPNTKKWIATYPTFTKVVDGIWKYCGNCFCGEVAERGKEPAYV